MKLEPTCPAASVIGSGPKGAPAIKCGIMERDQAKADRILEGAPVGVVLSAVDDTSQVFGFCCGTDDPPTDRDAAYAAAEAGGRLPCHHSLCPIWAAAEEWDEGLERLFGAPERPETEARDGSVQVGAEAASDAEIQEALGLEVVR